MGRFDYMEDLVELAGAFTPFEAMCVSICCSKRDHRLSQCFAGQAKGGKIAIFGCQKSN